MGGTIFTLHSFLYNQTHTHTHTKQASASDG